MMTTYYSNHLFFCYCYYHLISASASCTSVILRYVLVGNSLTVSIADSALSTLSLFPFAHSTSSFLFFGNSIPDSIFAIAAAEVDLVAAALPPLFPPLAPGYSSFDNSFTSPLIGTSSLLGNFPFNKGFSGTCSFLNFNFLNRSALLSVSFFSSISTPSSSSTSFFLAPIS